MISSGVIFKSDNIRVIIHSGTKKNHNKIAKKVHKLQFPISASKKEIGVKMGNWGTSSSLLMAKQNKLKEKSHVDIFIKQHLGITGTDLS